jgi:hypothetical protein
MDEKQEASAILEMLRGELPAALHLLQGQLDVIHSRAQVLTGLSGVVVTVTGFSGRLIASSSLAAQIFVILGLATVLIGAISVMRRVMDIRWTTQDLGKPAEETVEVILRRRNQKSTALRRGWRVLYAGLLLYFVAIALMLINPEPVTLPVR